MPMCRACECNTYELRNVDGEWYCLNCARDAGWLTPEQQLAARDAEIARLKAELAAARAALRPFAAVAAGIPDSWPGQCPLRIDSGPVWRGNGRQYEWMAYHGVGNDGRTLDCDALLPSIAEWRAAEAARGGEQ